MKFNKLKHLLLFGGGNTLLQTAISCKKNNLDIAVFTSSRHADEIILAELSLAQHCENENLPIFITDDINVCEELNTYDLSNSLGIGFGEAWSFNKDLIEKFQGKLFDLMGIRLPRYRGGAHYTWQILRQNKIGACFLQEINEFMIQGEFDNGEILKSKQYFFPKSVRIPKDYFDAAQEQEITYIQEFIDELTQGKEFIKHDLPEHFSMYFPRLHTINQGLINWNWDTKDIEHFICAFDEPYAGASTQLNGEKVHLKSVSSDNEDGPFHPFQFGLIYKIFNGSAFIATKSGAIIVDQILNQYKENIILNLKHGMRLFTPNDWLENAMLYSPNYTPTGLK
ncbi:MAG: hypothetical protein SGJ04_01305 [Bacteroidota bacterium]|nr:hypothetical protein [Bacteroidota bacterium]